MGKRLIERKNFAFGNSQTGTGKVRVNEIANAIALELADDEAASIAGISDMTLTTWRRDPEFLGKIKNAVSTRLAMRLSRIESGG